MEVKNNSYYKVIHQRVDTLHKPFNQFKTHSLANFPSDRKKKKEKVELLGVTFKQHVSCFNGNVCNQTHKLLLLYFGRHWDGS